MNFFEVFFVFQLINDLFDVMNSRTPRTFGWKAPVCTSRLPLLYSKLEEARTFLLSLHGGPLEKPLHKSGR